MIVLTGAGGFIGSVILGYLNRQGIKDVYLFDDLPLRTQYKNLVGKEFISLHSTREIVGDPEGIKAVIHFGANANTLETDWSSIYQTNVVSTRRWYDWCEEHGVPFIFASSAAIYGNGQGPMNHYAFSKWVAEKELTKAVILRLFNVYGPNEYHKGRMASVMLNWSAQARTKGVIKVFEHSDLYKRDFIWVEDVAKTVHYFIDHYQPGIYDLGTGQSHDFDTISNLLLENLTAIKEYIPMPDDLKQQYQTDTVADTKALISAGVAVDGFLTPQWGIKQYCQYLESGSFY